MSFTKQQNYILIEGDDVDFIARLAKDIEQDWEEVWARPLLPPAPEDKVLLKGFGEELRWQSLQIDSPLLLYVVSRPSRSPYDLEVVIPALQAQINTSVFLIMREQVEIPAASASLPRFGFSGEYAPALAQLRSAIHEHRGLRMKTVSAKDVARHQSMMDVVRALRCKTDR